MMKAENKIREEIMEISSKAERNATYAREKREE
jgi:hypothetical protein